MVRQHVTSATFLEHDLHSLRITQRSMEVFVFSYMNMYMYVFMYIIYNVFEYM